MKPKTTLWQSSGLAVAFCLSLTCAFCGCQKYDDLRATILALESQVADASNTLSEAREDLWTVQSRLDDLAHEEFVTDLRPVAQETEIDQQKLAARELAEAWNDRRESLESLALKNEVASLQERAVTIPKQTQMFVDGGRDQHGNQIPGTETRIHDAEMNHGAKLTDEGTIESQSVWSAIFSLDSLLLWLLCLSSILLIWAIARQDLRHLIRARRRALVNAISLGVVSSLKAMPQLVVIGKWTCFALVALAVVVFSLRSHRPTEGELLTAHKLRLEKKLADLQGETERLVELAQQLEAEAASKEETNDQNFVTYVNNLTTELVGSPSGSNIAELERYLTQMRGVTQPGSARSPSTADAALRSLRNLSQSIRVAQSAIPESQRHANAVTSGDAALAAFQDAARLHQRKAVAGRAIIVGICFAFSLGLVVSWRRRRSKLNHAIANVCPRCLEEDTLESSADGALVKCGNDSCEYTMEAEYRQALRLRIPTVGFSESGKSVWLTMFHRYVEQGRADTQQVKFDHAPSPGISDAMYIDILRGLVEQRVAPPPTLDVSEGSTRLRAPLLFHFSDGDRVSTASGILNLFDLAGAVSSPEARRTSPVLQDRAYRATDGFLYFIDPTRVDEEYLDKQRKQLLDFCDQLRKKRNVPYGRPLNVPIAVCISKLDMLARPEEAGAGVYQEFINELNPATRELKPSLKELRRRHQVFTSYREQLFPGWDIEEQFQKLVGGRYLFFPMSAAGFTGVTGHDPKNWNFKPFGITEPLIWLLHMNGFKTL